MQAGPLEDVFIIDTKVIKQGNELDEKNIQLGVEMG
jgi:hypothetical protein